MPFQQAIWKIGQDLIPLQASSLGSENALEEFILKDISILESNWLLIGRQVRTAFNKEIDLLALNEEGTVIVIELKRERTPRDVTAQVLDYGSWVQTLDQEDLEGIFKEFQQRYCKGQLERSLDQAFSEKFQGAIFPGFEDVVGQEHELVVVASQVDASTERILSYLRGTWGLPLRAVFFRVYKDGETQYLTREWFEEEDEGGGGTGGSGRTPIGNWNGIWCMTFGSPNDRNWDDAMKWGYVAAGGSKFWGPPLLKLKPQDQLLVWVPGAGYTAVAEVEAEAVPARQFKVPDENGNLEPFAPKHVQNPKFFSYPDNPDECEYIVKVRWLGNGPASRELAFKEDGLFVGLSLPVYAPKKSHWATTVDRVKKHFGV